MLIKIVPEHDLSRNFTLFDNAEGVKCECPVHFTDTSELKAWVEQKRHHADYVHALLVDRMQFILDDVSSDVGRAATLLSKSLVYVASAITFTREGKQHVVLFDGEAYICSDEGKTLERIIAGGIYADAAETTGAARYAS